MKKVILIILASLLLVILLVLFIYHIVIGQFKIYTLTYDKPVIVKYNQEKYDISEVKDKVKVEFIGRKNDIYLANQAADVILDLTTYEASDEEYTVPYEFKCFVNGVECNLLEKEAKVKITEK